MSRLRLVKRLTTGVAFALFTTVCGGEVENVLTKEEALALFNGLQAAVFDDQAPPLHISQDSIVIGCPQGGRAKIVGGPMIGTWVADTFRTTIEGDITPDGCKVSSGGLSFTVGGDPSYRFQQRIDVIGKPTATGAAATGSIAGGIAWELGDGRSGKCAVDLTLGAEPDFSTPGQPKLNGVFKGKVCDHEVEIDVGNLLVDLD